MGPTKASRYYTFRRTRAGETNGDGFLNGAWHRIAKP